MSFFQKKINRIYIVLIFPFALWTGYQTYSNYDDSNYWAEAMKAQYAIVDRDRAQGVRKERLEINRKNADKYFYRVQDADRQGAKFGLITVILLSFPLIMRFIIFTYKWVLHGEPRMTRADAIKGLMKALRLPPHEPRMTIADAIKGLIKALVLIGFIVYLYWIIVISP